MFTEIPGDQGPAFDAAVARAFGRPLTPKDYLRFPFATGRITARDAASRSTKAKIGASGRWAFDDDISLSAIGAAAGGRRRHRRPLVAGQLRRSAAGRAWTTRWPRRART